MLDRFLRRGKPSPGAGGGAGSPSEPAPLTIGQALAIAVGHHQAGRLGEAERIYARILDADPSDFDALHLLGLVFHQRGDFGRAVELISKAASVNDSSAQAHSNLGESYRRLGRIADAESSFRRAIGLQPDLFDAHYNLGLLLLARRELVQAWDAFSRAVALRPDFPMAHGNLGKVLRELGEPAAARASYDRALALQPDSAELCNDLGVLLQAQGDRHAAEAHYRRALGFRPDLATAHCNLGSLLREQGKREEAKACYRSALTLDPGLAVAHVNLGNLCREEGRLDDALRHRQEAARLLPEQADLQAGLGDLLHLMGRFADAMTAFESAFALDPRSAEAAFGVGVCLVSLGRHDDAVEWFEKALALDPDMAAARWGRVIAQVPPVYSSARDVGARRAAFAERLKELEAWLGTRTVPDAPPVVGSMQPFLLAYQDDSNRELLARYGRLCVRLMADWQERRAAPTRRPPAGKARLRIGIASAQVYEHSVWSAIVKGWLTHLDPGAFELHVFHLGTRSDGETAYARARAARLEVGPKTLEQWTDLISSRQLDALVYPEVGMDAMTLRLASLRLAPVQAASWGHPETTGLPTIDYYLSAEDFEPPEGRDNYSERLIALPHMGCAVSPYEGPVSTPDLAALGLNGGKPLLICPGTPFKYTPANDVPLVEIARRLGSCRFVFFTHDRLPHLSARVRSRLAGEFERAGLDAEGFLAFVPWQTRPAFYGLMQRAVVYLDTIGFSGFNTAVQALECGLPVVAREGRFLRSRLASGILRRAGLAELVAASDESYVEIATRLVLDQTHRDEMRAKIVGARAALFGDVAPVRALATFLESACRETAAG